MTLTYDEIITAWKIELAAGDAMVVTTELAENTLNTLINQKVENERLDTALASALKFSSELEADKRLANVELDRLNSEVARLTSDCKTLSAVLSKDVESDKEAVTAFIGFLEEHAKTEVFKRPKINLDCEAKFLYIDDIKQLEKEFWEGDNNDENQHNNV